MSNHPNIIAVRLGSGILVTQGNYLWFITFDRLCLWTYERLIEKTMLLWRRDE